MIASASIVSALLLSNITGPYPIHVSSAPSQPLQLSVVTPPPSQIALGGTAAVGINVKNPTSNPVQGYVTVNITASDFTTGLSDISISMQSSGIFGGTSGWFAFPTVSSIPNGLMYRNQNLLTFSAGANDSATIYIVFNKANPTASGYYAITIGITSS
jgi:hypothetical protein